jgi:uncharacterized lipoprotein YmbA
MIARRRAGPRSAMRPASALALAVLLLVASGCSVSTPPIQHLQLSSGSAAGGSRDTPVILIEAVDLPDYLLRDELARRVDDVTLHYNPYLRWAEPLDLAVQRVLADRLGALLDTRQVVRFPDPPRGDVDWVLRVRLQRLEREAKRAVLYGEASWVRPGTPDKTVSSLTMEETEALPADASGADAARALSELLARFARALADALQTTGVIEPGPGPHTPSDEKEKNSWKTSISTF